VPLYFQLARLMREEIIRGRWPVGARISSEFELGSAHEISRTTVRQALLSLEQDGLIERVKGRGTFVAGAQAPAWFLESSGGFFHDELDGGVDVTSRVLRVEKAPLPLWAAEELRLPPASDGTVIERLRHADGRAAMYVIDYLRPELFAAAGDIGERDSLYTLLENAARLRVFGARRTIESITAGPDLGALLGVQPHAPVLLIESVAWDETSVPFHCFTSYVRTDRLRVEVQVTRASGLR
jgi:GntR family transcriptional regulator